MANNTSTGPWMPEGFTPWPTEGFKPQKDVKTYSGSETIGTESDQKAPAEKWVEGQGPSTFSPTSSVTVFDVAAYVIARLGPLSAMKLHKLLYYCQAWSLVWDEKPLYNERIEAWANGPVVPTLYTFHRGQFLVERVTIGNPDVLSPKQIETVNSVLKYYGDKPSQWLIDLSHMERPWKDARQNLKPSERGTTEISNEAMAEYYSSL